MAHIPHTEDSSLVRELRAAEDRNREILRAHATHFEFIDADIRRCAAYTRAEQENALIAALLTFLADVPGGAPTTTGDPSCDS